MSLPDFEKFRDIVIGDRALLDDLRGEPDLASLSAKVIGRARDYGLEICDQDLQQIANANRRAWLERWLHQ